MKQIEDNLNEILEVLEGNGVPNNEWIRKQITETLELVKNNGVLDAVIKCDCEDNNYALVEITENLCLECNKPIK